MAIITCINPGVTFDQGQPVVDDGIDATTGDQKIRLPSADSEAIYGSVMDNIDSTSKRVKVITAGKWIVKIRGNCDVGDELGTVSGEDGLRNTRMGAAVSLEEITGKADADVSYVFADLKPRATSKVVDGNIGIFRNVFSGSVAIGDVLVVTGYDSATGLYNVDRPSADAEDKKVVIAKEAASASGDKIECYSSGVALANVASFPAAGDSIMVQQDSFQAIVPTSGEQTFGDVVSSNPGGLFLVSLGASSGGAVLSVRAGDGTVVQDDGGLEGTLDQALDVVQAVNNSVGSNILLPLDHNVILCESLFSGPISVGSVLVITGYDATDNIYEVNRPSAADENKVTVIAKTATTVLGDKMLCWISGAAEVLFLGTPAINARLMTWTDSFEARIAQPPAVGFAVMSTGTVISGTRYGVFFSKAGSTIITEADWGASISNITAPKFFFLVQTTYGGTVRTMYFHLLSPWTWADHRLIVMEPAVPTMKFTGEFGDKRTTVPNEAYFRFHVITEDFTVQSLQTSIPASFEWSKLFYFMKGVPWTPPGMNVVVEFFQLLSVSDTEFNGLLVYGFKITVDVLHTAWANVYIATTNSPTNLTIRTEL